MRITSKTVEIIACSRCCFISNSTDRFDDTNTKEALPIYQYFDALRSGVPIVPVALVGTQRLYFRKTLTLRFGKRLTFPQKAHPKRREIEQVLEHLASALQELLPSDYAEPDEPQPLADFLNQMFC